MGATHLIKLNDMITLFDIQEPKNQGDNAQEIIDLFKTSLNGPARNWYELNITETIRGNTLADWEEIIKKFCSIITQLAQQLSNKWPLWTL